MTVQVTLDNTMGAAFIGTSASCFLFGVLIVQTSSYYQSFPKDRTFQKASVAILMTLETLHLIFTFHSIYFYLIVNFGNTESLGNVIWSFKLQVLINTLIVLFVQSLYTFRVWKFGRHFSRFWPGLVAFIVAGGWAVGLLTVAMAYRERSLVNLDAIKPVIRATFATAAGMDAMLATVMCYYLNRCRSSLVGTNNRIIAVMRYILITGSLTSACSLSTLIAYITMPDNLVFISINLLLPNLYISSYIAMLNARKSINEHETSSINVSRALNTRSGSSLLDDRNLSVDTKTTPDSLPLPTTKFTTKFLNVYDLDQDILSQHDEL